MQSDVELLRLLRRAVSVSRRKGKEERSEEAGKETCGGEKRRHRGLWYLLSLLEEGEGKSQSTLAKEAGIRPQSVSEAVSLLEERGFVRRSEGTEDRRISLVFITPLGREHSREVEKERRKRAKHFFAPLTEGEKESLAMLLEKLCEEEEVI